MEPLSRDQIKEVFSESIAPLVAEFKAAHEAHEKDIDRLNRQSNEHYQNHKQLEEKIIKQVNSCQKHNLQSQKESGVRVGTTEKDIARIDQRILEIEHDISEMKSNKQFNVSQWLVVAGVIAVIFFEVLPYL